MAPKNERYARRLDLQRSKSLRHISNRLRYLLVFFFILGVCSQTCGMVLEEDSFLLRGRIRNAQRTELKLAVTHPIRNEVFSIPLEKDGSFSKRLPIVGETQDVYLYLFDAVTCLTFPGDTLELDYTDGVQDFHLSGTHPARNRELLLEKQLYERFRQRWVEAKNYYGSCTYTVPLPDSALNDAVKYIQDYSRVIDEFEKAHGSLPHKIYQKQRAAFDMFAAMSFLSDKNALNQLLGKIITSENADYLLFNTTDFNPLKNPSSTDFMFRLISNYLNRIDEVFDWHNRDFRPKMRNALAIIPNDTIREWYILSEFRSAMLFEHLSPLELRPVTQWLEANLSVPFFRSYFRKLKEILDTMPVPGRQAPDFMLKDLHGKKVSLSALRGKYVYLDFWNTACAPCLAEFKQMPRLQKDNAAFADSICYLSVCMGQSEDGWRQRCKTLTHEGIHLYTPSEKDPQFAPYRIEAFPAYWLIAPDGRILTANCYRPSQIVGHFASVPDYMRQVVHYFEQELERLSKQE